MAKSKVISVRVPKLLLEGIDKLAAEQYPARRGDREPKRSQLILDALEKYASGVSVSALDNRVEACVDDVIKRMTVAIERVGRHPDLEAIRDRILSSSKDAIERRRLRSILNKFIEECRAHEQITC